MKVVITGATGFVGPWLQRELAAAGHEIQAAPPSRELDVADGPALAEFLGDSAPDAVAHLAAVANAPAAEADPARALRTNLGGTIALLEAARALHAAPCLLVVSSAEVYGPPRRADLPLSERAPIAPRGLYALTKAGQEAAATAGAARYGLRLVVARPFNHAGPGQPPLGAVAAFAARVADVQRGAARELPTGNLEVERDISDVRDIVRAYRLLLEAMADGTLADSPSIFNIASGTGTSLRWIVDELCRLADVAPPVVTAPELVRRDDPPRIVGDATALREAVGWQPQIPLTRTLADMLASSARRPAPQPA